MESKGEGPSVERGRARERDAAHRQGSPHTLDLRLAPPPLADAEGENALKIILLGDSAVGKSKLVERFLMQEYQPRMLSTYALTLFRHNATINGEEVKVDFWDTAGQERAILP